MMRTYFEAYKGDAPYAFVSYSHIDSEMVYPVIKELNDEGYRIWYDEGIAPSAEWRGVINEHIRDCSVFVVFVTRNSMDSHEVIKECTYAINLHKMLHIIYLEKVSDSLISPNLIADFTNNQRVHAYEMHSSVFAKRLREPLAGCKDEITEETAAPTENKIEKKAPQTANEDGYSPFVRTFRKAKPSFLWATGRMSLLLAATLVISWIILFVNMQTEASVGLTVLINIICLLCLIPLIFWMRKTKYGNGAVISSDKMQSGFVSETVYTAVCRFAFALWALLLYTFSASVFDGLDSWISLVWPVFMLTFITEFASVFFSVVSRCILSPMLKGKKQARTTPLVWHVFFQVSEIINIVKAGLIVLCSYLVSDANLHDKMFSTYYNYNLTRIGELWSHAYLLMWLAAFTLIARVIMLFHEKAVFKLGKALVNGK